jgi:hypothetical protein
MSKVVKFPVSEKYFMPKYHNVSSLRRATYNLAQWRPVRGYTLGDCVQGREISAVKRLDSTLGLNYQNSRKPSSQTRIDTIPAAAFPTFLHYT